MSDDLTPSTHASAIAVYEIRIQGYLGCQWTDWFDDLTITQDDHGQTVLTGPVADQAALYGLLRKVRDLGIPLVSVHRLSATEQNRDKETQP